MCVCLSVCLSVCVHAMLIHNYWGLQMLYAPPPENETGSSFHIHWAHRPAHSSQISPESVSGCLCFSVVLHTHTHSYTPHLRSTSFLLEVSPTHTCTSKFSSLTRTSPFGVTRGHAQTWEEESPKGIQLSEENTKLGDIIPPLWSCMSYLKHKTTHTRACMHSHTCLIRRSASITSLPQGQGALLAQDLGREQHTQHHSGTHEKQASRKECISYSYLADHSFIQTQSDTVRPE